jgi:hypothetical protein
MGVGRDGMNESVLITEFQVKGRASFCRLILKRPEPHWETVLNSVESERGPRKGLHLRYLWCKYMAVMERRQQHFFQDLLQLIKRLLQETLV